jgi:hypothetical protein
MDLRRLRVGEWVAGLSGVALFVALFLPWYEGEPIRLTAWEALAVNDVILGAVAAAAVAMVAVTATQPVAAVPIAFQSLLALGGLVALVLVLVRVLWLPDLAETREWGLVVALAAATGIAGGALIAARDERLSRRGRHTDATGKPGPPPPEIEVLPAPRP